MLRYALSIRQPWAWAIFQAGKDIENRDWPTHHRGEFYIHAAKGMARAEYADFVEFYDNSIRRLKPDLPACPERGALLYGGIIGKVQLVDCVRDHSSPWFCGKYGFVLADSQPLPFQPFTGQLGFFSIDGEE